MVRATVRLGDNVVDVIGSIGQRPATIVAAPIVSFPEHPHAVGGTWKRIREWLRGDTWRNGVLPCCL